MKNNEKKTIFVFFNDVRFFDLKHTTKGVNSAKIEDVLFNLPKTIPKILNIPSAATGNIEGSFEEISDNDLESERIEKIILPSNINVIHTKLEVLLRIILSGQTKFLSAASNFRDEIYNRGEIQNKQQYRTALDKFHNQQKELPSILLEQKAINTRPKTEEHKLNAMHKSTHEEHLSHLYKLKRINSKKLLLSSPVITEYLMYKVKQ